MKYLLIIALGFINFNAFSQETITAAQAKDFIGKEVFLVEKVAGIRLFKNLTGDLLLLNIDKTYPNNEITVSINRETLVKGKFTETELLNKNIKVKGTITIYKEKPEIKLQNEADLTIVE